MSHYEKSVKKFMELPNPCIKYNVVLNLHINHNITDELWFEYCDVCLKYLAKEREVK